MPASVVYRSYLKYLNISPGSPSTSSNFPISCSYSVATFRLAQFPAATVRWYSQVSWEKARIRHLKQEKSQCMFILQYYRVYFCMIKGLQVGLALLCWVLLDYTVKKRACSANLLIHKFKHEMILGNCSSYMHAWSHRHLSHRQKIGVDKKEGRSHLTALMAKHEFCYFTDLC